MNAKWTVVGFNHRDEVYYEWTHAMVDVTSELTPGQLEQVVTWAENHDVWFSSKRKKFLCRSAIELSAVENGLTTVGHSYDVEMSDLTADDKACIQQAQIKNRNRIAAVLDVPDKICWATVTAVDTSRPRGITVKRGSRVAECYGTLIPSVGAKVLVTFVDGDADKPCVIGKVLGV